MSLLEQIPSDLINFIVVLAFSLLIGLEQRVHHIDLEKKLLFGTDRTFTLIGILGYIMYIIQPESLIAFIAGGFGILLLLSISYYRRIQTSNNYGVTSIIIALLTYSLTPLLYLENKILVISVFVSIIVLTGVKHDLKTFARKFDSQEFLTLAKFIILSGVILPLLPKKSLFTGIDLSLYKIWIAVIAISGISYLSYIIKKFIFPNAGLMLTAVLGGLYSSTATTIILAKKSNKSPTYKVVAGIIAATSMMYLRLLILAFVFNKTVAIKLTPYFILLSIFSGVIAYYFYQKEKDIPLNINLKEKADKNPLEFTTAIIFGLLFAFFSILTDYILKHYGQSGINILSLIVGVTDIDPFVLNLFQNGLKIMTGYGIVKSVLLATTGNNIVKLAYSLFFGVKPIKKPVSIGFILIILLSFLFILIKF